MHNYQKFYQGSSVSVSARVLNGNTKEPVPLGEYDAEAVVFTRLHGEKIKIPAIGQVNIHYIDGSTLSVNIPPEETKKLPAGDCFMELKLTHRATGAVIISRPQICVIEQSINK